MPGRQGHSALKTAPSQLPLGSAVPNATAPGEFWGLHHTDDVS